MNKLSKFIILLLIVCDVSLYVRILLGTRNVQILNPQGFIASQEKELLIVCISLMLVVVIPVFILAFHVATSYHEDDKKAKYTPDWDHSTKLQIFLWAFPSFIILLLCIIIWRSAHELDPHVAIEPGKKPFVVQVFSLRYKWLFVYPQQGIASLNLVEFPQKTPVVFEITSSDSPMTSFWIPQLGGQVYAMSGMATQTHLMADGVGQYRGASTEINGAGFADMIFTAKSVTNSDFTSWVKDVKKSPKKLTYDTFRKLDAPGVNKSVIYYSSTPDNLFTTIVMQYMAKPGNGENSGSEAMSGMEGMGN